MNEENKNLEEILQKHEENIRKGINEDVKRHIGVLVEDMDGKIKLLAEGQQVLGNKIDRVAEDLKVVKQDVEYLKEDMDFVKSEIVEIKDRFKETDEVEKDHKNRIAKLETAVLAEA